MSRWEMFVVTMSLNWRFLVACFSKRHDESKFDMFGTKRSWKWPQVRDNHLKKEPDCQLCGVLDDVEVHHILAIWLRPDLELCPDNLMTLCRPHHFLCGHLCDWSTLNLTAREDAAKWRAKIRRREQFGLSEYTIGVNHD